MLHRFLYTPDAPPTTGADQRKSPVKAPKYPRKAADFAKLALKIAASWKLNPGLTLMWITQAAFEQQAKDFDKAQTDRMTAGGSRSGITSGISALGTQADDALKFVKGYILDKWEDKATAIAQYPRYGIRKIGAKYLLPGDQSQRLEALNMMVKALTTDGFGIKKYGTAFWTTLRDSYKTATDSAGATDGTVSLKVGDKQSLREEIEDGMTALQLIIIANYRNTWAQVLRDWGWQKEDY